MSRPDRCHPPAPGNKYQARLIVVAILDGGIPLIPGCYVPHDFVDLESPPTPSTYIHPSYSLSRVEAPGTITRCPPRLRIVAIK